jgi:D-alanyl-D-alanine carboxypeptidase
VSARQAGSIVLVLGALAVCAGVSGAAVQSRPPVGAVAKDLVAHKATSAIVLVSDHGRAYAATAGKRHPKTSQRFRIGGLTATFTAALVLQLVQEDKLRLSDRLARYLPGVVPEGRRIRIRDLLQHQSGLDDPSDAEVAKAERIASWTPLQSLRLVASKPLLFSPGTQWRYSNENYIALGLIVEKVTAHSYGDELKQRILQPLHLRSTELPTTRKLRDIADAGMNPQLAWAAGGIVSNAHDVARFYGALLSGRVVNQASLALMEKRVGITSMFGLFDSDGLGLLSTAYHCGRLWGHIGRVYDSWSVVESSADGKRVAVIAWRGPDYRLPDMLSLMCG